MPADGSNAPRINAGVFYFSWTGNTERVARALADALGCDCEPIVERRPKRTRLRCVLDAMLRRRPAIHPTKRRLSEYDVVIIGGPVWARGMAGPIRSFLSGPSQNIRHAAVFCTEAGEGGETVLDIMGQATSAPILARCVVSAADFASDAWRDKVNAFAAAIRTAVRPPTRLSVVG